MYTLPWLTDDELVDLCAGLVRSSAQLRYLRGRGLHVDTKPNGRPLLMRSELERVMGAARHQPANAPTSPTGTPNEQALLTLINGGRRGQKAQGR